MLPFKLRGYRGFGRPHPGDDISQSLKRGGGRGWDMWRKSFRQRNCMYKGPEVGVCLQQGGEGSLGQNACRGVTAGWVDNGADRPDGAL